MAHSVIIDVVCLFIWNPFGLRLVKIIFFVPNKTIGTNASGTARSIFYLQNGMWRYIIHPALGHSLMVEHRTLTPLVLVRIQLPQPLVF